MRQSQRGPREYAQNPLGPRAVPGMEPSSPLPEAIDERAAIMEVDGGLAAEEADNRARIEALRPGAGPSTEPALTLEIGNRFLNQWVESIWRSTDASKPLAIFAGVGLLSSVCHKFFFYSPRETHLNIFLFILGPSSSARKTTTLDITSDYLAEVAPDLILPHEFTSEALFSRLARQPQGTVFVRELNLWLDQLLGKDYNKGLASTLGNIYDHTRRITRETKKSGLEVIENPVLTIIGAGVDEYLITKLKELDMISGFWPRVTLIRLPPRQAQPPRPPGKFLVEHNILEKLRAIVAQEGREIGFELIEPRRQAFADQLYREAAELDNPNLATGYCRLEWILVKIAALLQLADQPESRQIELPAFSDAITLIEYVKQGMPDFYSERERPDEEARLAEWALKYIKKHDENHTVWLPYRKILQARGGTATGKLQAALRRLLETEDIEESNIPPNKLGGKAGKAYRSVGE